MIDMWKTFKINSISDGTIKAEDENGRKAILPTYTGLEEMAPGEEIHIFVAKDKDGLIRKIVGGLIDNSR
jgi:hypothetical protein